MKQQKGLILAILFACLCFKGLSKSFYISRFEKLDTNKLNNKVFVTLTGTNTIFGTNPNNNPLRFEGSVLYSYDFEVLRVNSVHISPLIGFNYFNNTFNSAQFKSQTFSLIYGLNTSVLIGNNKQIEVGLQTALFNEIVNTLSNNSVLSYSQHGYQFSTYVGPNLMIKSLGICPYVFLGYSERTKYRYETDRRLLNLKFGIQVKI